MMLDKCSPLALLAAMYAGAGSHAALASTGAAAATTLQTAIIAPRGPTKAALAAGAPETVALDSGLVLDLLRRALTAASTSGAPQSNETHTSTPQTHTSTPQTHSSMPRTHTMMPQTHTTSPATHTSSPVTNQAP